MVRNGQAGNGQDRFLTVKDLQDGIALAARQGGAGGSSSGGSSGSSYVANLIQSLSDQIMQSRLWRLLGERIERIEMPAWFDKRLLTGISTEIKRREIVEDGLAQSITTVSAALDDGLALMQQEITSVADSTSAFAASTTTALASLGENLSGVQTSVTSLTTAVSAQATEFTQAITNVNGNIALVDSRVTSVSDAASVTASQVTTLQLTLNGVDQVADGAAVLAQQALVLSQTIDGAVDAAWTVKFDANGYVAGIGFGLEGGGATPYTSAFGVRADQFFIGAPNSGLVTDAPSTSAPFIVQTTNWTDANGVIQPPGVFIKGAFIESASIDSADIRYAAIQNAHIGDLQVSTLKIAGNAVTVPMTVNMPAQVSGTGVGVPLISGSIYLPQAGVVYAIFTGSQGYGSGLRDSTTQLFIDGNLMMSVGGAAVTVNVAVSGSMAVSAGLHTVAVRWVGQDSGVHMDNGTLFIQGAMR